MDKSSAVEWILEGMFDNKVSNKDEIASILMQMTDNELLEFMRVRRLYDLGILEEDDMEKIRVILAKYNYLLLI